MTILVQPMPWLRTAAFSLALRAGVDVESTSVSGLSGLVCEMVQRGAGSHSSRELVSIQDNLGMDRSSGVSTSTSNFGASMPAESLRQAIALYAEIVQNPHLPEGQLEDARLMSLQEIRANEDEPTHRVMQRLRQMHYGPVLGRSTHGTQDGIQSIKQSDVRSFFESYYQAAGSILAVAGNVDADHVYQWVEESFGQWKTQPLSEIAAASGETGYEHLTSGSSQTHIGFSFDTIPYGHPEYFKMRAGIGILSDGMSSRLFDRVREQQGLCYTVTASCHSLKQHAGVFGYAGTTPERAQQTLDVTLDEVNHLTQGLTTAELERWQIRIQSLLIMEQESSASRASSIASDFYQVGRPITTQELESAIESLTVEQVHDYWLNHPPRDYRIVTLGPNRLSTPQDLK
ncbi:insulinase family protein [Rhodopirellula sp.]|nr:insulinase family protein [Rhodopirellula sp.]